VAREQSKHQYEGDPAARSLASPHPLYPHRRSTAAIMSFSLLSTSSR
jgi:hypothetical protein